jgi:hypothetical protein
MNNKRTIIWPLTGALTLVTLLLAVTGVWAEPNPITLTAPSAPLVVFSNTISFQGRLLDSAGDPVDGTPAMNFRVYTQAIGGTPVWEDGYTVPVENGLFNASLEIPPALFDGQALWLGVQVEGDAQEMTPRQQLLPAPYALYAKSAPWNGLVGVPSDLTDGDDDTLYSAETGLTLFGTQFSIVPAYRLPQGCANGAIAEWNASSGTWNCGTDDVGSGAAAWLLGGNADTTPGTDVLGTTDAVSLTLVVNGVPALRLEPAAVPNLIGGYRGNSVASGVQGATIGGGGGNGIPNIVTADYGTVGGGAWNTASGDDATVAGGVANTASGMDATVGGGIANTASGNHATTIGGGYANTASGLETTIGGGWTNIASGAGATISGGSYNAASGDYSFAAGGSDNIASGDYATIGGGTTNVVSGTYATVAGGTTNVVSGTYATVAGGKENTAIGAYATIGGGGYNTASGYQATIGGGQANTASGNWATVAGGDNNTASGMDATVAGGWNNTASGESATISGGEYNTASGDYSFAAGRRANAAADGCFVWGDSTDADFNCSNPNRFMVRASGGVYLYTNSTASTGAYLAPNSGSWSSLSDRNAKENFGSVDPEYVLEQVVQMPVSTWNYIGEADGIRHLGPMAQDFYAAFGLGDSERYINTLDANGVALTAIQGLYAKNQALATENAALQMRVDDLETENAAQEKELENLETRLAALERGGTPQAVSTLTTWWPLAGAVVLTGIVVAQRRR